MGPPTLAPMNLMMGARFRMDSMDMEMRLLAYPMIYAAS